ncbi:flagellar hook assembly protein FlgD [Burkholderia plantarii]|uniref:Basal-body rod modification protein FlgD n=1 Tax=Burkholderia plantarii TaxID=41899 RepID=A0A0B6S0P5_BURPL|nr:flagellar hook assembly protein FlgD [Burkholderia plantarii]AJK47974.1 flagellar hook capping protein FlgD [Burkholderia plantarii]
MSSTTNSIGSNGTNTSNVPTDTMSNNSGLSSTSAADLQQTFLTLLVTQLQNQDPTSPVDSSQMTSQLAQINTVSGIAQLNSSLSSLSSQLTAGQQTQAALLIGTNVLAPGSTLNVASGTGTGFGVELPAAATDVKVTIKNSAGTVVNTIDAGAQAAGTIPFNWTPTDSSGATLPDGQYTISASYTDGTGATNTATTLTAAQVQSVIRQADGTPGLVLSNGTTVGLPNVGAIFPAASSGSSGSGSGSGSDNNNSSST